VEYRLRRGDDTLSVALGSAGDASVDGASHRLDDVVAGPSALVAGATVQDLTFSLDGRSCRALVARLRDRVLVALDGRTYGFDVGDEARGGHAAAGSGAVTAPMPGKVVSVLVAVGDTVEIGRPLVVLEAMKMESTLAAEVAGRVRAVPVSAGSTVAAGDLLVEIEPDGA